MPSSGAERPTKHHSECRIVESYRRSQNDFRCLPLYCHNLITCHISDTAISNTYSFRFIHCSNVGLSTMNICAALPNTTIHWNHDVKHFSDGHTRCAEQTEWINTMKREELTIGQCNYIKVITRYLSSWCLTANSLVS